MAKKSMFFLKQCISTTIPSLLKNTYTILYHTFTKGKEEEELIKAVSLTL